MRLLAVVLDSPTAARTLDAIAAVHRALDRIPSGRIDVVADGSRSDGLGLLARGIRDAGHDPARVRLLPGPRDRGLGASLNVAIRRALADDDPPDFVYLVGPDALPAPTAIDALLAFFQARPEVGLAGSEVRGPDGAAHETAFRFPSLWGELAHGLAPAVLADRGAANAPAPTRTRQVDWVAGTSAMVRRAVFEDVGLFDETFLLGFDEADLCRRALLAGWPTYHVVESRVVCTGPGSTGARERERISRRWLASRAHYFRKNHGEAYLRAADLASSLADATLRARHAKGT